MFDNVPCGGNTIGDGLLVNPWWCFWLSVKFWAEAQFYNITHLGELILKAVDYNAWLANWIAPAFNLLPVFDVDHFVFQFNLALDAIWPYIAITAAFIPFQFFLLTVGMMAISEGLLIFIRIWWTIKRTIPFV